MAGLDTGLGGGMVYGRVHEIYAAETDDAGAAAGFAAAMAAGMAATKGPVLWLRSRRSSSVAGVIQANGWAELGGAPGQAIVGIVPDTMALLQATADGLRNPGLGGVIAEGWGPMRELGLTASRRLALAAEKSGVPLFLLRVDAAPVPSAAQTRWQVAAAPSCALPGRAPGLPTFDITLLRQRSGPSGLSWQVEWDRDQRKFREAAVSGAVVPLSARRPTADTGGGLPRPNRQDAA